VGSVDPYDYDGHRLFGRCCPLPRPYVVPGGRFREIYYWDSYFTMLGLVQSGRRDLTQDMVRDFAYLIDTSATYPTARAPIT